MPSPERERRRREELLRSLENPHAEGPNVEEEGLREWAGTLPHEDTNALVDAGAGKPIRWMPGEGWIEKDE